MSVPKACRYDLTREIMHDVPRPMVEVERVRYVPETDTMYLAGTTWDHMIAEAPNAMWGLCGRAVVKYENWSTPDRRMARQFLFPDDAIYIKSITLAPESNLLFAGEGTTMTIFTYDTDTGELLGIIEPDESRLGGRLGAWIDIPAGIRAYTRNNGEVLILCEEVAYQKQLVYRLKPQDFQ